MGSSGCCATTDGVCTRYSLGVYYRCAYTSSTSTYSSGTLGSLYGSYSGSGNDPNDVAAAGAVVWLFILGCVVGTWVGVFLCMKCCIDQRKVQGLGPPKQEAYIIAILLCFFIGPCVMWIPFVMDNCYTNYGRQGQAGPTAFVAGQAQMTATATIVQPVQVQPGGVVIQAAQAYNPQVGVAPMAQPQVAVAVAMPLQQQQPQVAMATAMPMSYNADKQSAFRP